MGSKHICIHHLHRVIHELTPKEGVTIRELSKIFRVKQAKLDFHIKTLEHLELIHQNDDKYLAR